MEWFIGIETKTRSYSDDMVDADAMEKPVMHFQTLAMRIMLVSVFYLAAPPLSASAAILIEDGCHGSPGGGCITRGEISSVYIYGMIDDDTAVAIARIDGMLPLDKPFPLVYINSDGGSAHSAEWIGRILRRRQASIEGRDVFHPDRDARCYSACVLVALGAVSRQFRDIGVHRSHIEFTKRGSIVDVQPSVPAQDNAMQAYIEEMGAHSDLRKAIDQTPFDAMTYFRYYDGKPDESQTIVTIGFHTRYDASPKGRDWPADALVQTSNEEALAAGARRGDVAASKELAARFLFGRGGQRSDIPLGISYLEEAAERGDIRSRHLLGVVYSNGYADVQVDKARAAAHFRIAAEAGFAGAQNNLGFFLFEGSGVEKNIPEAVYWITRAAEQGEPFAYSSLGEMRFEGGGFPPDDVETFKWLQLAVKHMPSGASRNYDVDLLAKVTARMTDAQLAEANKRVAAWRPLVQARVTMLDKDD